MDNNTIDIRNKYMTKITHTHTRVGKEYQAVIPDYLPKEKRSKEEKKKDLEEMNMEHKAHIDIEREEQIEEDKLDKPRKKRKLEEEKK